MEKFNLLQALNCAVKTAAVTGIYACALFITTKLVIIVA